MHARLAPTVAALPRGSRVFITGGSGFIGTNLIDALVEHAVVLNIDVLPPRAPAQTPYWTHLDVREHAALRERIRDFRPDIVLHCAARTDLMGRRIEDYETNTVGTEALLDALAATAFAGTAVFFSSMLTNRPGRTSSSLGQGDPDTHYGESKLQMEELVQAARPGYRYVVVRPTSIWGPWFAEPYRKFFDMVLQNRYFHPGPRTATKTFGFVGNTVYQTLTLAMRGAMGDAPIYLGDAPPVAIADWANEIAAMAKVQAPRRIPELAGNIAALGGDALERIGVRAPLTTRRLNNMRQDNVVDLGPLLALAPQPPFSRAEGTALTLNWLAAPRQSWG